MVGNNPVWGKVGIAFNVSLSSKILSCLDERKKQEIAKQIRQKQVEFSLMMERQKRQRRQK